ncbi:GntR family transcriptional regulator [Micromonospora carbonacea]|uniref:GntR family transcriptional regulator n=1 Tax=Micromonospora carbonacea TaxID=47853 RepID=UPI0033D068D6
MTLSKTSARYGEQVPTPHYGQPRYRTIADELRQRIESGVIPPGALLPAESALTAEFRASRGTIRQAIALLRAAGVLVTDHGRGTYANPGSPVGDSASEVETRERHIAANAEIASLFAVEVGTVLIEHRSITRTNGAVSLVVVKYRLLQLQRDCLRVP